MSLILRRACGEQRIKTTQSRRKPMRSVGVMFELAMSVNWSTSECAAAPTRATASLPFPPPQRAKIDASEVGASAGAASRSLLSRLWLSRSLWPRFRWPETPMRPHATRRSPGRRGASERNATSSGHSQCSLSSAEADLQPSSTCRLYKIQVNSRPSIIANAEARFEVSRLSSVVFYIIEKYCYVRLIEKMLSRNYSSNTQCIAFWQSYNTSNYKGGKIE